MNKPFLILFIIISHFGLAQNLVPNPSFEIYDTCPTTLSSPGDYQINHALGWYSPTMATSDYYNACNSTIVNVPNNLLGYQVAKDGNGYAGIHTKDYVIEHDYREYIQCELISSLNTGQLYEVSFFVSLADSVKIACNNIGAYLSSSPVSSSGNLTLPYAPQIISPINTPVTSKTDWTEITGTFMVTGGEKYITIGLFTTNANTNWANVSGGWMDGSYYYIDDVSVTKVETNVNDTTKTEDIIYPNTFTPNNDNVNDFWSPTLIGENDIIVIYNRWGNKIATLNYSNNKWDGKTPTGKECPSGVYYFITNTNQKGFIQLIR